MAMFSSLTTKILTSSCLANYQYVIGGTDESKLTIGVRILDKSTGEW